eukprot:scaffold63273_cov25-Attheya_sp.AAC.2
MKEYRTKYSQRPTTARERQRERIERLGHNNDSDEDQLVSGLGPPSSGGSGLGCNPGPSYHW